MRLADRLRRSALLIQNPVTGTADELHVQWSGVIGVMRIERPVRRPLASLAQHRTCQASSRHFSSDDVVRSRLLGIACPETVDIGALVARAPTLEAGILLTSERDAGMEAMRICDAEAVPRAVHATATVQIADQGMEGTATRRICTDTGHGAPASHSACPSWLTAPTECATNSAFPVAKSATTSWQTATPMWAAEWMLCKPDIRTFSLCQSFC